MEYVCADNYQPESMRLFLNTDLPEATTVRVNRARAEVGMIKGKSKKTKVDNEKQ